MTEGTKARTNLSESEWRRYSSEWEKSKESQSMFCRRHQLNYKLFKSWRAKFRQSARPSKSTFGQVQLTPSPSTGISAYPIRLTLPSGVIIGVSNQAGNNSLKQLFRLLGVTAC